MTRERAHPNVGRTPREGTRRRRINEGDGGQTGMTNPQNQTLNGEWKDRLDLSLREAGELYEDVRDAGRSPHAGAIRAALEDLDASGVFCVQDVPTVVIAELADYDRRRVVDLHAALWNQGLATLLLVLSQDTVRAFSLARKPERVTGWRDAFAGNRICDQRRAPFRNREVRGPTSSGLHVGLRAGRRCIGCPNESSCGNRRATEHRRAGGRA